MYHIGLDIGTSGCKAFVYSSDGKITGSAYHEYTLTHPKPGWSEMTPSVVWNGIVSTLKESVENSKLDAKEIGALSISALGHDIMAVGKDANWLYPTIQIYDQRATKQAMELQKKLGPDTLKKITRSPNIQAPIAYVMWFKEEMPEIYNKAAKFVGWHEYVIWRLCGEPVIDHSLASCISAFDIRKGTWSEEILDAAGVDPELMPRAELAGTTVGEVASDMSEKTGLAKGTAVVVGAHDTDVSMLGAGAIEDGVWMDLTGTFEIVFAALAKPIEGSRPLCDRINRSRDIPMISGGGISTSGSLFKWYKDTFAQEEQAESRRSGRDVYDILTEQAASANPGSDKLLLLPDFSGRGGSSGALLGLMLGHGKKEVVRSILEGLCFELRHSIERNEEYISPAKEIRAMGGGAKSPFWLQLKSNIVNKRFVRPEVTEGGSLGASILAGIGIGTFKDAHEGVKSTYRERDVYSPQTEEAATYDKYYRLHKRIRPMLAEFYKDLNEI